MQKTAYNQSNQDGKESRKSNAGPIYRLIESMTRYFLVIGILHYGAVVALSMQGYTEALQYLPSLLELLAPPALVILGMTITAFTTWFTSR